MYSILVVVHSYIRWLVLVSLIYAIYRACKGWLNNTPFSNANNTIRQITVTVAQVQLVIGIWLYTVSPVTQYFLHHLREAMHQRRLRFFGMEHITMMIIAVTIITIGSSLAKLQSSDRLKFKTIAIWFSLGLLIILMAIPWKFSPLV